jgi:hypothetical protein
LSILAFPVAVYLQFFLQNWFPALLLALPGVFGYWVGWKLKNLRFWRHIVPMVMLLIAGGYVGFELSYTMGAMSLELGLEPSFFDGFLWVFSPAALYSFAVLLGNARQRRHSAQLMEDGSSRESESAAPGQQEIVGLIGTIISALSSVVGLIVAVINATSVGGG